MDMSELWPTAELWPENYFMKNCHWMAGTLGCNLQNLEAYLAEDEKGEEYLVWNHDSICTGNPILTKDSPRRQMPKTTGLNSPSQIVLL